MRTISCKLPAENFHAEDSIPEGNSSCRKYSCGGIHSESSFKDSTRSSPFGCGGLNRFAHAARQPPGHIVWWLGCGVVGLLGCWVVGSATPTATTATPPNQHKHQHHQHHQQHTNNTTNTNNTNKAKKTREHQKNEKKHRINQKLAQERCGSIPKWRQKIEKNAIHRPKLPQIGTKGGQGQ